MMQVFKLSLNRGFLVRSLISWLFAVVLTTPVLAGTFTGFGPNTYARRSEQPVTVSDSFTVLNPNTQYTLNIQNSRVSSAVISINGVRIERSDDFDGKPATIALA